MKRSRFILRSATALLLVFSPLWSAPLSRIHDPVILTGDEAPSFLNQPKTSIRLYRYIKATGSWEPVLFQIDELDNADNYLGIKDGLLSPKDEIVFMARDMGDMATDDLWPENAVSRQYNRFQIQVSDPVNSGETGYAYLFLSSSMDQSDLSYFNLSQPEDWISTSAYTVQHGSHGFQSGLFMNPSAGGDSLSIIERQKFRVIGRIYGINEEIGIKEEMDGEIDILNGMEHIDAYVGPKSVTYLPVHAVRVHRYLELEYRFKGSIGILGFSMKVDQQGSYQFLTTFYPTYAEWSSGELDIKEIDEINFREVRITTDLRPNALGMRFYNPYNKNGIRIDETSDTFNSTIPWPGDSWNLITANPGDPESRLTRASLVTVTRIPTIPSNSSGKLYLKDSQSRVKYDTGDDESWGDNGFSMTGNSLKGPINFTAATYYLPQNLSYNEAEALAGQHLNPLDHQLSSQNITYPIALDIDPWQGGQITTSPPISKFPAHSTVTLTAKSGAGYRFDGWTGDIESQDNPLIFQIENPVHLTAKFSPTYHDVVIRSNPQGMAFSTDGAIFLTPATFSWEDGSRHYIQARMIIQTGTGERQIFKEWQHGKPSGFQYTVESHDTVFTAFYIHQFLLTADSEDLTAGQIVILPDETWYEAGSEVSLTAVPAADYSFSTWSGDTATFDSRLNLFMNHPWTLMAHFTNAPPVIAPADTSMDEDHILVLTPADLNRWIEDDASPLNTLVFEMTGTEHLIVEVNPETDFIRISPARQWSGQDTVWMNVTDPLGAFTHAPLAVTVRPVADPPETFSLLIPENQSGFVGWPVSMEFLWEASSDPDPADTVLYIFELDTSLTFQSPSGIHIKDLQWTQYVLLWPPHLGDGTYYWRVQAEDRSGLVTSCESVFSLALTTDVTSNEHLIPDDFILEQNTPNPFNGSTLFRYGLPRDGQVSLSVINSQGKIVRQLWDGSQKAGFHVMHWHGKDDQDRNVSSGMYLILFRSENRCNVRKVIVLR